jgi:hypothetical protein
VAFPVVSRCVMMLPTDLHHYLPTKDGFCHPDWQGLAELMETTVPQEKWGLLWHMIARIWVEELRMTLGNRYQIVDTPHFLILCKSRTRVSKDARVFCEVTLRRICSAFYGLVPGAGYGKKVVLIFDQPEDYERYVRYFCSPGSHPMSGGTFLRGEGYPHVALLTTGDTTYRTALVHELTHDCFSQFPLPTWINEALAMRMEREICGTEAYPLDRERRARHAAHWNPTTIQPFWSGVAWEVPSATSDLNFSLAQILWRFIEAALDPAPAALMAFLGGAHRDNGGEESFRDLFDLGLGDVVTEFLGEGEWAPWPGIWKHEDSLVPHE